MKSVYFKRIMLLFIAFLLIAMVLILSAYSFIGKQTYLQLEVEDVDALIDTAQSFYLHVEDVFIDLSSYVAMLHLLEESSNAKLFYVIGPFSNIGDNDYLKQVALSAISGNSVSDTDSKALGSIASICLAEPLISNHNTVDGAIILVKQTSHIQNAFDKLNSVLWIMTAFMLPPVILVAYISAQRMSKPMRDMTNIAIEVTRGNYGVRANENLTGEMGIFARAMNRMSEEISKTIFQLNSEKRQLGHILSSFSDGVAAIDELGNLTHYNPALMQMFGTVDISAPIDLVPDRTIWDAFNDVIDQKDPRTLHYEMSGDRMVWISIVPVIGDNDSCIGAVGLFKDMSEIEKLERMRRDYVANVSHELRTPLTAVRGLLEPLADGMIKDEATKARYYAIMLKEVERLSRLITDLLQLSRLQSGTEYMEIKSFDINELLNDMIQSYKVEAANRGITLSLVTDDLPNVSSDPDRIEQVLIILLDNAMRYAGAGGTVELMTRQDDHWVFVSVNDNGCGIKPEDIGHIFERFYKADKSRKEGGTGLGLSIAKQIIDKLGEQISVVSNVGEGTSFTISVKKYVANAIQLGPVESVEMFADDFNTPQAPNADEGQTNATYEVVPDTRQGSRKRRK